jgi:5-methylcytosine-specific restriction endonuclease McrA
MIANPVSYENDDVTIVASFEALPPSDQSGNYWSDPSLDGLKTRIKTYYITAQNTRCCYCNRHLGSDNHRLWDVEHIASRAKHARFMFVPTNLAAACPDCNSRKGDSEALVNTKRKTYPTSSEGFRILHPHFDNFQDHIHNVDLVYLPKTEKGKKTIYACDLLRFAQKFIDWENSAADASFENKVEQIFNEDNKTSEAAVEAIITELKIK